MVHLTLMFEVVFSCGILNTGAKTKKLGQIFFFHLQLTASVHWWLFSKACLMLERWTKRYPRSSDRSSSSSSLSPVSLPLEAISLRSDAVNVGRECCYSSSNDSLSTGLTRELEWVLRVQSLVVSPTLSSTGDGHCSKLALTFWLFPLICRLFHDERYTRALHCMW